MALALTLVACGGQSSRHDRRETEGDAGTPSSGGTAGTNTGGKPSGGTGAGGTSGINTGGTNAGGTNAGGTNAGGINTGGINTGGINTGGTRGVCESLRLEYLDALERAKACNPAQSSPRCDHLYRSGFPCGCPTFANESPELEAYQAAWSENVCPQPPCPPCDSPTGALCSEAGRCEDITQPRCDGLLDYPSPVCDYGMPCNDARDCLYGDCYVPGTGENPVCSKYCDATNLCPIGAACVAVGSDGSHCFVRCTSDEVCLSINAAPENPLACVEIGTESVCIQESEP